MDTNQIITDIETRAAAAGLSITELCRQADVAPVTFQRWQEGLNSPTLRTLNRLTTAVESAEKDVRKAG